MSIVVPRSKDRPIYCTPNPQDVVRRWSATPSTMWIAGSIDKTATSDQLANLRTHLRLANAAYLHFKSAANQIRFTLTRNALLLNSLGPAERESCITAIEKIAKDEIQIAKQLFTLTRQDSRIGFEASNHYYYFDRSTRPDREGDKLRIHSKSLASSSVQHRK